MEKWNLMLKKMFAVHPSVTLTMIVLIYRGTVGTDEGCYDQLFLG